jgi:Dolichyl-phosphate-mannose-protein mannosyltransferase
VRLGFGSRFAGVAGLVTPYVGAMAVLGVARVLVAHRTARGAGRPLAARVGAVAAVQALLIVAFGRTPGAVAACTFAAAVLLLAAAAAPGAAVIPFPAARRAAGTDVAARLRRPRDRRTLIAVGAITAVALAVRLWATRSLWLDEATSVTQAQMPLGGMLHSLRTTDVHPPLHHLALWVTVHLFGTAQMVVRGPSIIAGTLLIPVLWATGRELYGPRAGMAAAALGAVAPFAVWYAQEARMYAFFMLFATVALLAQLRAMRTGERRWWALLAVAGAALVWTQYFAAFVVLVLHGGTAWQLLRAYREGEPVRERLLGWLGAVALSALLVAPLLHFALGQFAANEAAGRGFDQSPSQAGGDVGGGRNGPGVYSALTDVVWAIWGYHSNGTMAALTALWPALMLGALLLLGRGRPGRSGIVTAVAFLPMLGMTVLGVAKPFLFEPRYFIALTPMVLLLFARATTGWTASRAGALLCTGGLAATLALGTADQQLNRSNPRLYDFKGALGEIHRLARPGDVLLYEPDYLGDLVAYMRPGVEARPLAKGIPRPDPSHRHRVIVLASFLDLRQHADATARGLTELGRGGRRQIAHFRKPQVKVWIYR